MKGRLLFEEIYRLFKEYKKFILIFNGIVFLAIIIYLLLAPKWYASRATFIISSQNPATALNYLQKILPGGFLPVGESNLNKYIILANSRKILTHLIEKFRLDTLYDFRYEEDLYRRISKQVKLKENPDGSLTIECLYKGNPYIAAEMANFIFEEIRMLSIEISNQQAKDYRLFLEKMYNETISDLHLYEDSLKKYQEDEGIFNVEEQAKQIISMLSELEKEKIKLEAEKVFLQRIQPSKSSKIVELENKISVIQSQIERIHKTNEYSNIPLSNLPEAAITYMRLYRSLKMKEIILEFLVPQLEQAKLEEKKNVEDIYLLDKAVPHFRKVKPKRLQLLIIYMMGSLMFTFISIKIWQYYLTIKNSTRPFSE